jgi:hypothetical protein
MGLAYPLRPGPRYDSVASSLRSPAWITPGYSRLRSTRPGRPPRGRHPDREPLFDATGAALGSGHNQRVQRHDPSAHAEVEAFRNAGRRRSYRDTIIATTLAPYWYCSGLIRRFGIGRVNGRYRARIRLRQRDRGISNAFVRTARSEPALMWTTSRKPQRRPGPLKQR